MNRSSSCSSSSWLWMSCTSMISEIIRYFSKLKSLLLYIYYSDYDRVQFHTVSKDSLLCCFLLYFFLHRDFAQKDGCIFKESQKIYFWVASENCCSNVNISIWLLKLFIVLFLSLLILLEWKHGRIHGYPSHVRVGRSSAGEGHQGTWAGAVCSKGPKTPKK